MRLRSCLATIAIATLCSAPAMAQSIDLVEAVKDFVVDVEAASGRPIAILERSDNDPNKFWYKAMQALCEATGDNWCEEEVRSILTDTTNQLGWARVITYRDENNATRVVCALLPPRPGLYPGYVATAVSSGAVLGQYELPTARETEAYLWLLHTASCLNDAGDAKEQKRADAYATLALTLIEGDGEFVGAFDETPSRLFNPWRNPTETRWATNVGERLLLDLWKDETADQLRQIPCTVTVVPSIDINTDFIERDAQIDGSDDCQSSTPSGFKSGKVTDENLWIWTGNYGGPTISMPPEPYSPFKMFDDGKAAATYIWTTANKLAGY